MQDETAGLHGTGAAGRPKAPVFHSVQALRGLAAMMVVLFHANLSLWETGIWTQKYFYFGSAGVDVFFPISGFVMVVTTASYWGRAGAWKDFLSKRLIRIVPMYWLFTSAKLAIVIAVPAMAHNSHFEWWHTIASYLFLPSRNNVTGEMQPVLPVGWTLDFEMMFYAVFVVGLIFSRRPIPLIMTVLTGLAAIGLFQPVDWNETLFLIDPILLEFVFGMAVGILALNGRYVRSRPVMFLLLVVIVLLPVLTSFYASIPIPGLRRLAMWGIGGGLLLLTAISFEAGGGRSSVFWEKLGNASYAIYLTHGFIVPLIALPFKMLHLQGPWAAAAVIAASLIVTAAVGMLTHRFIEDPLLRQAKRLFIPKAKQNVSVFSSS